MIACLQPLCLIVPVSMLWLKMKGKNPVMITLEVTKGKALLPGGSVTLPAYTGIGGQTAVSIRSYEPGEVEVTASSQGLESSTIIINCIP